MAGTKGVMKAFQYVLLILVAVLSTVWWVTGAGFFDLSGYYPITLGLAVGFFLLLQSGILTYIKESKYKVINSDDVVTWFLALAGGAIIFSSLTFIPQLNFSIPKGVKSFLNMLNIIAGLIGIVMMSISTYKITKK